MGKYIVGITGASGSIYAKRVIERLIQKGHHVCICMTQAGKLVVESELGWQIGQDTPSGEVEQYLQEIFGSKELIHHYDVHAIGAPIASGSSGMDAMIVVPCSMGTLSAICHGSSHNLLERAAPPGHRTQGSALQPDSSGKHDKAVRLRGCHNACVPWILLPSKVN